MARYHPLYRWLALDGYGFHQGFFYTRDFVENQRSPRSLSRPAERVFDQGLGRSMWFSQGANPERIATAISAFPITRQNDLWSGAGLAAAYAGGVPRDLLEALRDRAGNCAAQLAQGAAFAAKARQRAGNPAAHTEIACEIFCQTSADVAAAVTDDCLESLPADGQTPAYQLWRAKISECFSLAGRPVVRTMAVEP
jgi:hypothetical protein